MTQQSYLVSGMTCDHCVTAVRDEISHLPGVIAVQVDLVPGAVSTVVVASEEPVAESSVREAVDEAGYEVVAVR
ncbi:MAG TPA: heavy-metal-associated domain-containing protein [Frankiaceae bacterium]|nr:heavy-metal-associated domain-containing protein [Frankiaceae bacterium]